MNAAALARLSVRSAGRRHSRVVLAGVLAVIALVCFHITKPYTMLPPASGSPATWHLELASTGSTPMRALVYGPEAGLHLLTIPSRNAPATERRGVLARIGRGDVYLLSLGWSSLEVATSRPEGVSSPLLSLSARGRMLRIFTTPSLTGVRTSWR